MNSNLKKLFGFATIAACSFGFAMNVNAAAATMDTTDSTKCIATDMESLKQCASGKVSGKEVKTIEVDAPDTEAEDGSTVAVTSFAIDSDITFAKGITKVDFKDKTVTINAGKTVTSKEAAIELSVANSELKVQSNANLDVTTEANNAISATTVTVNKGKVTVSADNSNGVVASKENDANAINATTLKVDGGVVTVSKGIVNAAINVAGVSTINAVKVEGGITVEDSDTNTTKAVIKVAEVSGNVALNDAATLTADKIGGTADANENSNINAKEIIGKLTVDGEGAVAQYAGENADIDVKQGVGRKTVVNQYGETHVEVEAIDVDSVKLAKDETLVIEDVNDIKKGFKIDAANGAKIDNKTDEDLNLTINGKTVVVSKDATGDDAYAVSNGTDVPVDPTEPTDPTDPTNPEKPGDGDDQPTDNPQTFDGILSYVGVALSSVGGLGVSLKKRLFR